MLRQYVICILICPLFFEVRHDCVLNFFRNFNIVLYKVSLIKKLSVSWVFDSGVVNQIELVDYQDIFFSRLEESGDVAARLQADLDAANEVIAKLTVEAEKGMSQQKILLSQYQEAEMESRELQDFLQAEKMTLAETLKVRVGGVIVIKYDDFNVVSHALLRSTVVRVHTHGVSLANNGADVTNRLSHFIRCNGPRPFHD